MAKAANGQAPPTPEAKRAFVQRALTARLLAEQTVAELAHLPLGALAVAMVWHEVSQVAAVLWLSALVVASLARLAIRIRARAGDLSHGVPQSVRIATVVVAAVWGVGIHGIAADVPVVQAALLLLIICGLTAAAASTLLADPPSYVMYTGGLLTLAAAGALRLAAHREFQIAFVIVLLYGAVMAMIYVRLRRVLLESLSNEYEVEQSRADADRERAFLALLFRSAPDAVVVLDRRHCVLRANPAFERLFGYSLEEAREHPLDELILPESEKTASTIFRARIEAGSTIQMDAKRRRRDGSEFDARIAATRVDSEDGVMLVMYSDITEQKTAERALRDSEARLFRTLASLPVGIMVVDVSGVPFFVNDAARDLLGKGLDATSRIERLAATYQAYIAGTDTLYPAERMPIVRALAGEEASADDIEIHRPDGNINLEVFGSPIRDSSGNVVFGVAAFTDITERRRIAEALNAARVAAEEATASKSAFLANMSHEIRTPLNGILGMAEVLLDGDLSAENRRSVETIISSGETLLRVINDILDFSKIEAGQLDIEHVEVDVPVLIESTARLLMAKASAAGIEVVIDIGADVPTRVVGDPTRLRQVLANLVGNAVKFTARGEVVIEVRRVGGDARTPSLRFSVCDTGAGIAAEKIDSIFEAFRQADTTTTRRYGGTGLGLSISRRLVELMGGNLMVTSTEGVGSTFTFTLPMPIADATERSASPTPRLADSKILIVDDNATNRRAMRSVLETAGSTVLDVQDGTSALSELRAAAHTGSPFAAVVSDVAMPGLDGFDLATAIRGDASIQSTPIVLASSIHRRGDHARTRSLGIAAYLLKPIPREDLLLALRQAIGRTGTPTGGVPIIADRAPAGAPARACRVLIAEDNVVNQEVASTVLRRRGHAVHVVGNGLAAVEAAATQPYDVILMDLQMPELDGIEATARIRTLPRGRDVRIIALTANAMAGERERCIAAGMDDYLAKPFKSVELVAAVENRPHTPQGAVSSVDAPPLDLHGLRTDLELGGVVEIMDDILDTFAHDSPARMEALRAAVASGDARTIERAAHAFKSGASTIRARPLADLLQGLERDARAGTLDDAVSMLARIEQAFAAVQRQLQSARGTETHGE